MPQRQDTRYKSGGVGEIAFGVRMDTPGTIADADLDYTPPQFDARGNLRQAPMLYNGTTDDPAKNNTEATIFASAARTATANSTDQTNHNARGLRLHLDITAASGTSPTLDVTLQAKINGVYINIAGAAFAQKTTTGTDELVVYPGIAETANESVSDILPRTWRAVATIAGTDPSFTFSLGCSYVL